MKKYTVLLVLLCIVLTITGCKQTKKTVSLKDINYSDLENIYSKNYYDLLPNHLYNEDLISQYEDTNFITLMTDIMNGEYEEHIPTLPLIDYPEAFQLQDLSNLSINNVQNNIGISGPIDMIYGQLASIEYLLQLLEVMNIEFEKQGNIHFDGTMLTIPTIEMTDIKDPFNQDKSLTFENISAKYEKENHISTIWIHTVNDYTYDDISLGTFNGELGLYLKVALSMTKDNKVNIDMNFYITLDLYAEAQLTGRTNDTASIQYKLGQSIKAIDQKKIVINNQIDSNINIQLANNEFGTITIPDIIENISTKSSFVLERKNEEIIADFTIVSNLFDQATLNYHLTTDDNNTTVYIDGMMSDTDFYGEILPTQSIQGIFIYEEEELIFIGGNAMITEKLYDDNGNFLDTKTDHYAGYLFNMNRITGWTKLQKTNNVDFPHTYILYNGNNVLLNEDDQTIKMNDGNFIELEKIIATTSTIDATDYHIALYFHLKRGDTISLTLADGLQSNYFDDINSKFNALDAIREEMIIDLNQGEYQVPELKVEFYQ